MRKSREAGNKKAGRRGSLAEVEKTVARLRHANVELEALVQIKSHLLSTVSHELRALLVAIRGYTKMLLEDRAGQINSAQRQYLNVVFENANRLVGLVSYSLPFITNQEVRLETFDIRELWQATVQAIESGARERSIKITECIPPEPLLITGDKEKLALVFEGLLSNALHFTEGGGEIIVEFTRGRNREVTVKVTDTGLGIPPELLDRVFHHQEHEVFAPSQNGGVPRVGLPMVYDLILLHGGRISVTSKLGEGATFVFTLPAVQAEQETNGVRP